MWGLLVLLAVAVGVVIVLGTAALSYLLARPPRLTLGRAMAMGLPTEPAEVDLTGESRTFDVTRRTRVPAFVLEGHAPDGPTVVMLHGLLESRYASLARAPVLADHAARLVLPDLRGHGESSRSLGYGGTVEVDDTLAQIEQLDAEGDLVLHGFSLGAGTAIATGARLSEAAARGDRELKRWRLTGVIAEGAYRYWTTPLREFLWFYRVPPWPFVPLLRLIHEPLNAGLRRYDRARDAAKLNVPLRMLHGADDWLCDVAHARAIADAADDGRLIEMPKATHMDIATADPERYRAAIADFFHDFEPPRP